MIFCLSFFSGHECEIRLNIEYFINGRPAAKYTIRYYADTMKKIDFLSTGIDNILISSGKTVIYCKFIFIRPSLSIR
jgi:hypothetical protein